MGEVLKRINSTYYTYTTVRASRRERNEGKSQEQNEIKATIAHTAFGATRGHAGRSKQRQNKQGRRRGGRAAEAAIQLKLIILNKETCSQQLQRQLSAHNKIHRGRFCFPSTTKHSSRTRVNNQASLRQPVLDVLVRGEWIDRAILQLHILRHSK